QTDGANCGGCGKACAAGSSCSAGMCSCGTGMTSCGGTCVNTQTDVNNCGSCSKACTNGAVCTAGAGTGGGKCTMNNMTYNGHITHYDLGGATVACHYPTNTLPQYYAAMNEFDYNAAAVCGACVEVTNGGNKLTVLIADECPYKGNEQWCFQGSHHIDMI